MALHDASSARSLERPEERIRSLHTGARLLPRPDLPVRQTSFVGRSAEIDELAQLLTSPDCRLLTIIGTGGIGKTRLALEVAETVRDAFADGVAFTRLQALSSAESIPTTVAVAIGCTLTGPGDVREQVARFLRPLRLLLVLDNFEHLIDGAGWIGELLDEAPGLRVLVTSREVLNLREEWRYPLTGLAMPPEDCEDPAESDAVRLFAERARQVRPDFTIAADPAGVIRLCRITEGLPLALELAAAWTRTLSCEEIADEIERNIAFLSTDLRNVPERQRSIQAAFDYSWALLNEDERRTFQRLAVFRGGFRREAAQQVAGATLPLLSSLVDKSLIRVGADGRFYLHELLRQYADEHLRAIPGEAERIAKAHREFYLAFVANRFAPIPGGITPEAIEEINAELGNIRAAWRGAVAAADSAGLGQAAHPLALFYDFRTRYREGLTMLEDGLRALRAADPSPEVERVIALLLVNSARFHHKLGDLPAMLAAIDEGEARYQQIGDPPPPGLMTDPGLWRALLTLVDGDYAEAARIGDEVIERNTAQDRLGNLPFTWWLRAAAALWQEDPAAGEYARRSTEAALAIDDRWNLTYSYNMQGHVATATGDYTGAWRYYEAGYALREEFNDPEGMGTNLGHMARVALLQGDLTQAEQLYRRSLSIAREIGDLVSIANALNGLGLTACATGDYASAGQHFAEGLQWTAETRFMRLLLILLASAGDWLLQTGQPAEAVGPLAIAQAHPAGDRETRARAAKLLATVAGALPPDIYAAAIDRHQGRDPAEQAAHLIPILTRQPATDEPATPDQSAPSALVEPLTARELDVLRLIAAGRSNREIADELFLAVNTVRSYSQQLYGKLAVSSRTQAVARARELGLIS